MSKFVHLHVHTEYSLLDGANRITDLVRRTCELGMDSIAITDHGVMYGVVDFYKECKKNNVNPILGCEVYTAVRSRFDKQPKIDAEQGHLVLLAENNVGYKNLMKLVSLGFTEGFYYKPRIDYEILEKYKEGLIALSACIAGDVPRAILRRNYDKAKKLALRLNSIMGQGNFYLELQMNGIEEQILVNQQLIKLSQETGIPLVATNDVHYLKKGGHRAQEILMCIQTAKTIEDQDRMQFHTDQLFLKSPEEMKEDFKNISSALENTCKIAERCHVEFDFGTIHLPQFDIPDEQDSFGYLKELCYQGLKKRYRDWGKHVERLEYELSVIKQMGYVDYFLIVWDFVRYAKEKKIMVGPGRGSAAGSIVSYCLGITSVDPVKYNLLFERFLNPERVSMPDIDIDFCFERRQEVIDYVVKKYGEDKVAQIITFGTMAARAVIRDVGRALAIPYADVDKIAKMIPMQIGMSIEKAMEVNPDIKKLCEKDEMIAELIETARLLEGMPRHVSTHAAGVVISKEPLTEYVPLYKNEESITTQFPMTTLEDLGLLKMDFLGLRTLTVIRDTLEYIKDSKGIEIDIENINMDDPNVYKMIGDGQTAGLFQLESAGMTQFMKELKPASLEDIIAGISLYRPGPMDEIPKYIRNKNNPEKIKYDHPFLEKILDVTYGCMVYQEQVMQIVRDLAGYSLGRSDLVRRAMAKKKKNIMEEERKNFIYGKVDDKGKVIIPGAIRKGLDEKTAAKIFDSMMDFASYAFNKSHAAAYAVIGYQTAWLKYYYPVEFIAALLNSFLGSSDKVSRYVLEARKMNIDILPPDINESQMRFSVIDGKIRFGLAAVKNMGENVVKNIISERKKSGLFKDFIDFCERMDSSEINKRCIESLIKCGAFDSMGIYRSQLISSFEKILDSINQNRKRNLKGQRSLFDIYEDSSCSLKFQFKKIDEYETRELLAMEKEMLGLYISGHPLQEYEDIIKQEATLFTSDLIEYSDQTGLVEADSALGKISDGMFARVAGIITDIKTITTRDGMLMAFLTFEDLYGQMEIVIFPNVFEKYKGIIKIDAMVWIEGKVSIREDEQPKILADKVNLVTKSNIPLALEINNGKEPDRDKTYRLKVFFSDLLGRKEKDAIFAMFDFFKGNTRVYLYEGSKEKPVKNHYKVQIGDTFINELIARVGKENVKLEKLK